MVILTCKVVKLWSGLGDDIVAVSTLTGYTGYKRLDAFIDETTKGTLQLQVIGQSMAMLPNLSLGGVSLSSDYQNA